MKIKEPMESIYANSSLDELDFMLLTELELNARATFQEIAAKMGTSTTTVRRRLERLLNEGFVSFATIADPVALGYLTMVEFGITVAGGKAEAVANKLMLHKNVRHLLATTGRYDLIAAVIIRNIQDFLEFMREDLGNIPEIAGIDTIVHLQQIKTNWPFLGRSADESIRKSKFRDLDSLDIALIGELEKDPRRAISAIAKDLDANRGVLGRKLQMLLEDGIIKIISIPDLVTLGYNIWTVISVQVEPGSIESVANQLKQYPNVTHVVLVSGSFQIRASTIFRNRDHMRDFVNHDLGSIRGVMHHETALNLKVYKRNLMLVAQKPYGREDR